MIDPSDASMAAASKILVIDDNPAILDVFYIMLSDIYAVTLQQEVKDIIKTVKDISPHLILLDKNLRNADGCDYCVALKKDVHFASIPIIMISANNTVGKACLDAGANTFIEKPFTIKFMIDTIQSYLHNI